MLRTSCQRLGRRMVVSSSSRRSPWHCSSTLSSFVVNKDEWQRPRNLNTLGYNARNFASSTDDNNDMMNDTTTITTTETPSFDDTMAKLFSENITEATDSVASDAAASVIPDVLFEPTWYNLADQAILAVNYVQHASGWSHAVSIVALTTALRVLMIPVFVKGQRNSSRMAHMQPEMQALKQKLESLGPNPDQETQIKYGLQMKALFKKYNCNPLSAMALPLVQAPVFMSMFFGLRKMPTYFGAELSQGGMLWFPDLTLSDPLYILPIGSALSFFIMIELGKDQMMASGNNPQQAQVMLNVFRAMTVVMVPVAINFSSAVLCYWVTNNTFSMLQSLAFRNAAIRKSLDIWDPPKPVPGMTEPKSITESVQEVIAKTQGKAVSEQDKMQQHNDTIETKKKAAAVMSGTKQKKRKQKRGGFRRG